MIEPTGVHPCGAFHDDRLSVGHDLLSTERVALVAQQSFSTRPLAVPPASLITKSTVSLQEPKRELREQASSSNESETENTAVKAQKQGWGSWLWSGAKRVGSSLASVACGAGSLAARGVGWAASAVVSTVTSPQQEESKEVPSEADGEEQETLEPDRMIHDMPAPSKESDEEGEVLEEVASLFEQAETEAFSREGASITPPSPSLAETQSTERGMLRRLGSSLWGGVSAAAGGIHTALGAIGSAATVVGEAGVRGLGYAYQGVSTVASTATRAALPTVVPVAVKAVIDRVEKANPFSVEATEEALSATVDGVHVVETFRSLSSELTSQIEHAINGEASPEGQQESLGALVKRTAIEAAFQHPYIAQGVQQNVMLAFQNIQHTIASIAPSDMNHSSYAAWDLSFPS